MLCKVAAREAVVAPVVLRESGGSGGGGGMVTAGLGRCCSLSCFVVAAAYTSRPLASSLQNRAVSSTPRPA